MNVFLKRLFWEIYSVILFSIFGVLLLSYYALNSVNQYRYQAHLQDIMSGTVSLLKSGIDRQKGENQQRWLSLSASLLNSDLSIRPLDKSKQDQPIIPISRYQKNKELEYFVIQQKLNTSNELFEFKFETFTEQIATATAFLLLNEIGRFDASERQEVFDKISESFSYPVYRSRRQDLNFDSRQLERLDRGETIIEWNKQFGRGLSINVYAPWGKSADVLVMGAIAFFEPYPVKIVISFFRGSHYFSQSLGTRQKVFSRTSEETDLIDFLAMWLDGSKLIDWLFSANFGLGTNGAVLLRNNLGIDITAIATDSFLTQLVVNLGGFSLMIYLILMTIATLLAYISGAKVTVLWLLAIGIFSVTVTITEVFPVFFLVFVAIAYSIKNGDFLFRNRRFLK